MSHQLETTKLRDAVFYAKVRDAIFWFNLAMACTEGSRADITFSLQGTNALQGKEGIFCGANWALLQTVRVSDPPDDPRGFIQNVGECAMSPKVIWLLLITCTLGVLHKETVSWKSLSSPALKDPHCSQWLEVCEVKPRWSLKCLWDSVNEISW